MPSFGVPLVASSEWWPEQRLDRVLPMACSGYVESRTLFVVGNPGISMLRCLRGEGRAQRIVI